MEYKDTLNLPKTDFPMKGNLPNREPEILKKWQDNAIYKKNLEQSKNKREGKIDKLYYDTSTKNNPSKFRKPNIGMILKARVDFNISLKKSWVIGDKDSDIELGKKCNMRSIYIINKKYHYESFFKPDFTVNNLSEAYEIISKS